MIDVLGDNGHHKLEMTEDGLSIDREKEKKKKEEESKNQNISDLKDYFNSDNPFKDFSLPDDFKKNNLSMYVYEQLKLKMIVKLHLKELECEDRISNAVMIANENHHKVRKVYQKTLLFLGKEVKKLKLKRKRISFWNLFNKKNNKET